LAFKWCSGFRNQAENWACKACALLLHQHALHLQMLLKEPFWAGRYVVITQRRQSLESADPDVIVEPAGLACPAQLAHLDRMPLQISCIGSQNAGQTPFFQSRTGRIAARRKLHTSVALHVMAGSWNAAGVQPEAGQTVAAKIRRRVAIFVEPSPFSHVSGMKNRFECLIQGLRGNSLDKAHSTNCPGSQLNNSPMQSSAMTSQSSHLMSIRQNITLGRG